MMYRHLDQVIATHFKTYKEALVLLGARQVGKTTILKKIFPHALYLSIDNESTRSILERYDISAYRQLLTTDTLTIIIDEIHELKNPGRAAKIFYDHLPNCQLILTGSSAFTIKNKTSESLAGRKIEYQLFPLTLSEYLVQQGLESQLSFPFFDTINQSLLKTEIIKPYDHQAILNNILVYGQYPAMLSHPSQPNYLRNLVDSVVFKDLVDLQLLENKQAALSLLKLLAHQIGSLVNYSELANRLGIDSRTVKRYIELFELSFIIFSLKPYATNQRDEIGKMSKIYFYDLGLRNGLIDNFSSLHERGDIGQLFENFVIMELYKSNQYGDFGYHFNYWRTKSGSEVDLVLSKHNQLIAVEVKNQARRVNKAFISRYPNSKMIVISKDNYWI